MFKKTLLVGLLLVLLFSMVYAADVAVAPASEPVIQPSRVASEPAAEPVAVPNNNLNLVDGLKVEFEAKDITPAGFWLDIYLTPATHNTLRSFNLKLAVTQNLTFNSATPTDVIINPIFGKVNAALFHNGSLGIMNKRYLYLSELNSSDTLSLTPQGKIHLGRVKLAFPNAQQASTAQVLVDTVPTQGFSTPNAQYSEGAYVLNVVPLTVCAPRNTWLGPVTICGTVDNGCGDVVLRPACPQNLACIDSTCQPVLSKALPTNAPQHDKTVLEQVSGSLSNGQLNKLQKLASIVNAVKAWLAAQ